jgi:hypothetical protein
MSLNTNYIEIPPLRSEEPKVPYPLPSEDERSKPLRVEFTLNARRSCERFPGSRESLKVYDRYACGLDNRLWWTGVSSRRSSSKQI